MKINLMGSRTLLFCILALPTSFSTTVLPESSKKWVKGGPEHSQDSALCCIVSCISILSLHKATQEATRIKENSLHSCQIQRVTIHAETTQYFHRSALYREDKSLRALLLLFTPAERGQSKRDHKPHLAQQKHHGLGHFV